MSTSGLALVVLHDVGDEAGGSPWRDAIEDAGWPGPVIAPDLPGHHGEPAPLDGAYDLVDAAWFTLRVLRAAGLATCPVIMGVGTSGWAAEIVALGERADALVLVDGLGGPWQSPTEWVSTQRNWIRAIADDPQAVTPASTDALDPRLRHRVPPMSGRSVAEKAAAELSVPVLVVQTPRSALGTVAAEELFAHFGPQASWRRIAERAPGLVAPAVIQWARTTLEEVAEQR
jgi:pimeloyl-ACP methyl ester carboxylesterase